jgi:hypothetical protein
VWQVASLELEMKQSALSRWPYIGLSITAHSLPTLASINRFRLRRDYLCFQLFCLSLPAQPEQRLHFRSADPKLLTHLRRCGRRSRKPQREGLE